MKPEFNGARIQTVDGEISIVANVTYDHELENGFHEWISVDVFFFDATMSSEEIRSAAIEKANALLKKAVSELE